MSFCAALQEHDAGIQTITAAKSFILFSYLGKEPGVFDVVIINDDLEKAYEELKDILNDVSKTQNHIVILALKSCARLWQHFLHAIKGCSLVFHHLCQKQWEELILEMEHMKH